jgi:hypothetical protein
MICHTDLLDSVGENFGVTFVKKRSQQANNSEFGE